jgi:hypothetical protein
MIIEPNSNDVLLGRGPNFSNYQGNLRFHKLVDERKREYNLTSMRQVKKRIAKEVVALVHASGGRFLKQEDPNDPLNEVWYEVDASVSEEKAKQALREKEYRKSGLDGEEVPTEKKASTSSSALHLELLSSLVQNSSCSLPSHIRPSLSHEELTSNSHLFGSSAMNPALVPNFPAQEMTLSSSLDPRLLLLHDNLIVGNPQGMYWQPSLLTTLALRFQLANLTQFDTATKLSEILLQQLVTQARVGVSVTEMNGCAAAVPKWVQAANDELQRSFELQSSQDSNEIKGSCSDSSGDTLSPTPEEETAVFALSSLATQGGDQAKGNLNDTPGNVCETLPPRKKRARRDMG